MMMKEMNAAAVAACGWRTRMTTEGGRRRYLPARDQIMISRARRKAAGHGRLEASLREGWPCSQQTKCMAVFYDAYRY